MEEDTPDEELLEEIAEEGGLPDTDDDATRRREGPGEADADLMDGEDDTPEEPDTASS